MLRQANKDNERFLAVPSHELRNPLASMMTALHLARSFTDGTKRLRALEIIEHRAGYPRRLVDDLLDVNRISHGKIRLQKENIDLRRTIADFDLFVQGQEPKEGALGIGLDPLRAISQQPYEGANFPFQSGANCRKSLSLSG